MRIVVHALFRIRNPHRAQQADRTFARLPTRRESVHAERFANLVADAHHRIERGHRLLEDQADAGAPHLAHLFVGQRQQITSLEDDAPSGNSARRFEQAQDRERRDGFAAARLADEPERLALADLERHRSAATTGRPVRRRRS